MTIKEPPIKRGRRRNRHKAFRPELPFEWRAKLKKLISGKDTLATTSADIMRRALKTYVSIIEQQQDGWTVVLKKGTEEKPFPVN